MKRTWLPLILVLIGTLSPAMAEEAADDRRQPVDVARAYVDAFLAGDMQTLLDHASPPLKKLMKDAATAGVMRDQSVGDGAQLVDEELSVTYHRRVKSTGGKAFAVMAQVEHDGQLVAFSVQPAGEAPAKPLKYPASKAADDRKQPDDVARRYVDAFLAGDMQPLLDHAAPALKAIMKDAATVAALRDQSVGNGAQTAGEEISVICNRRVKSTEGKAFAVMAQVVPDGQLIAFSVQPVEANVAPRKIERGSDAPAPAAQKSPFAAVRWQQSQPEVKVGEEWFKLVSLDGLPASEIVAFSRRTYRDRWQMRFEEDLVDLLTRMGHPPRDRVTLVVQSLTSPEKRTLEDVAMTGENRAAIKAAAASRLAEQEQPTRGAAPAQEGSKQTAKRKRSVPAEAPQKSEETIDVPAEALEKLVGVYELAPGLPITVEAVDGKLMIALLGQPPLQVFARSETVWFYKVVDVTFTFNVDKNGKCDSLVMSQRQTAKRTQGVPTPGQEVKPEPNATVGPRPG